VDYGSFGAVGMVFSTVVVSHTSAAGTRYEVEQTAGRWELPSGGLAALAALAALAVFGSGLTSRSRTEHRVARVSAPIEFGTRGL